MAEAWINHLCGEVFSTESAGLEPGKLNPDVVRAMEEVDIDISGQPTWGGFCTVQQGRDLRLGGHRV